MPPRPCRRFYGRISHLHRVKQEKHWLWWCQRLRPHHRQRGNIEHHGVPLGEQLGRARAECLWRSSRVESKWNMHAPRQDSYCAKPRQPECRRCGEHVFVSRAVVPMARHNDSMATPWQHAQRYSPSVRGRPSYSPAMTVGATRMGWAVLVERTGIISRGAIDVSWHARTPQLVVSTLAMCGGKQDAAL